jgi:murein DD-endopeptidase MepM/ murein hydrolase activator NlpD
MSASSSRNRDFSFWYVCSQTGSVNRYSIARWKIRAITGISLILLLGLLFVAGDYSRIQALRARGIKNLFKLTDYNAALIDGKEDLKERVTDLAESKERVEAYEQDLTNRVNELREILAQATKIGVVEKEPVAAIVSEQGATKGSARLESLGGAESACIIGISGRCIGEDLPSGAGSLFSAEGIFSGQGARGFSSSRSNSGSLELGAGVDLVTVLSRLGQLLKSLPLRIPADGKATSGFGMRVSPFSHSIRMHEGLDISLPTGSAIYAAADGVVTSVKRHPSYGNMVDIEHRSGLVTRYAHLLQSQVKVGQKIEAAQKIALSGSTGRSTGPHLHYEVRVDDKPINPQYLFRLSDRIREVFSRPFSS